MGKTSIANAAMLRTAKAGYGVLCFSLEMSTQALAARCLSDLSWSPDRRIPYADALAGRIVDPYDTTSARVHPAATRLPMAPPGRVGA
jgi:replicative DNA helicase